MTAINTSQELDDLGERFHEWKQHNPHQCIPKEFWNAALVHCDQYDHNAVAKAIGCEPSIIRHKQWKKQHAVPEVTFVEIQQSRPAFDNNSIEITIQNRVGMSTKLYFHCSLEQFLPLISSLSKGGSICSK